MIVALSGRRIDAADAAEERFPLSATRNVRAALRKFLEDNSATSLVCSAACGADLIALSEAGALGLRRQVIVPFGREKFRESSVVDRPGAWGELYDRIMNELEPRGELIVLAGAGEPEAYQETNRRILSEAITQSQASGQRVTALLVWEGASRGDDDFTASFGAQARQQQIPVAEILTV